MKWWSWHYLWIIPLNQIYRHPVLATASLGAIVFGASKLISKKRAQKNEI